MSLSSHVAEPSLNATPLIDVLLVLLVMIIFTIPVMTHNVSVDLPRPSSGGQRPERVSLDIDFDGALFWNGEAGPSIAALEQRLLAPHPPQPPNPNPPPAGHPAAHRP